MCRTALAASILMACCMFPGVARAAPPALPGHHAACRDGACEPSCPVRPGRYGYYATQWRRWPGTERPSENPRDAVTPAPPERALVPGPDEESPRAAEEQAPAATLPPAAGARLDRLVAEADAARLSDESRQREFTVRLVAAMLSEPDPRVRCSILGLAAGFETPAAEAICSGALEDPDPLVRRAACRICGERRGPDAVARLARRARDDADFGVRLRAVRALGDLGLMEAVPHLAALLDDPDPAVRARAMTALGRVSGRDFGTDVAKWRAWAADPQALPPRWSLGAALRTLF